jgi:hypothetical protein
VELPCTRGGIEFDQPIDQIRNSVTGRRVGGTDVTVSDEDSISAYLTRHFSLGELPLRSDNEVRSRSEWMIYQYKDPQLRVESIVVKPATLPSGSDGWTANQMWTAALGADITQRFRIRRRPQGVGTAIESEVICEGVEHTVGRGMNTWTTTLFLSPAPPQFWIWGTSEWGETDNPTTRWGY